MSLEPTKLTQNLYHYLLDVSLRENQICQELRKRIQEDKYCMMQMNPDSSQFLAFLAKTIGAKRCIEVGTYMGYTSLCLALAIPEEGELITLDIDKRCYPIALEYWKKAKVNDKIKFCLSPALVSLEKLLENAENIGAFDLIFIDADKKNYLAYYELALKLIRINGIIAIDNTLWGGAVIDLNVQDVSTQSIRNLNQKLKDDIRIGLSFLSIGDGLSLARRCI